MYKRQVGEGGVKQDTRYPVNAYQVPGTYLQYMLRLVPCRFSRNHIFPGFKLLNFFFFVVLRGHNSNETEQMNWQFQNRPHEQKLGLLGYIYYRDSGRTAEGHLAEEV